MSASKAYGLLTGGMSWIAGILVFSIFLIVLSDILVRNLFDVSFIAASELSILLLVYASFVGAAYAVPEKLHFVLADAKNWLPTRFHRLVDAVIDTIVAAFSVLIGYFGFKLGMAEMDQMIAALGIPYGLMYMAMPTFAVLALAGLALKYACARDAREEPQERVSI